MKSFFRQRPLAMVGAVAVLLIAVAALAPARFALSPELPDTTAALPNTPELLDYALFALCAITAMAILTWIAWTTGNPMSQKQRQQRMWGQLLIIGIVASVIALFARARTYLFDEGGSGNAKRRGLQIGQKIGAGPRDVNPWVLLAMVVGALALAVAAAVYILRKKAQRAEEDDFDLFYDEMGRGIEDLQTIPHARNAVIACYARMERAVERAGIGRRRSDTPMELLERMLADRKVRGDAPHELTSLFEIAKFSAAPIDDSMRARAIDALVEIRMQLSMAQETA